MDTGTHSNSIGTPTIEVASPILTIEQYCHGAIVAFIATGITRAGVELFYARAGNYFEQQLAASLPVFYLVEIRANVALTPQARDLTEKFMTQYPNIYGRAAYMFDGGILMQIVKNFVLIMQARRWRTITFREFKNKDEALAWLYEGWQAATSSTPE